jgi:thermolabile hemolysin
VEVTVNHLRHGIFILCCALLLLADNSAIAQTPTTTHLRCFYRIAPSNLTPDTDWVWAVDPAIIERAKNDTSFNKNEFLTKFKTAHPSGFGPRPSLKEVQKWSQKISELPKRPYVNLSLNDPATTQQVDDSDLDKVRGYWYSRPDILANVFYSQTKQQDFVEICNLSLALQGIQSPVAMYAAAWNYASYDYMIWTNDNPVENQSGKINKIISFGDSVSDMQNMFNGTYWWLPTQYNYFIGHFSNGPVWVNYLSGEMNLPLYDWAIGGAASQSVYDGLLKGVKYQVNSYIAYKKYAENYVPEQTLFTVLIGANDLISYGLNAKKIYNNVLTALTNLVLKGGARNIMMVNLPDISRAPIFTTPSHRADKAYIHCEVLKYNKKLKKHLVNDILNSLEEKGSRIDASELNIQLFDAFKLVNSFIDNHDHYGISNPTNPCLNLTRDSVFNYTMQRYPSPGCTIAPNQADSYLFWDLLHPTTHTHHLLADSAYCFIVEKYGISLADAQKEKVCPPTDGLITENTEDVLADQQTKDKCLTTDDE